MSIHPGTILTRATEGMADANSTCFFGSGELLFSRHIYFTIRVSIIYPVQSYAGKLNVWSWRSWQQSQSILVCFQLSMVCFSRCMPFCARNHLTMTSATPWLMSSERLPIKYLVYFYFLQL